MEKPKVALDEMSPPYVALIGVPEKDSYFEATVLAETGNYVMITYTVGTMRYLDKIPWHHLELVRVKREMKRI